MYGKLFSRITESSLMEEDIPVRYTFVMMIAIADPKGYVIGTDIAIARRLNMPLKEFERCTAALGAPDENSNSKAHEGRRIIPSDCERGYKIVNYETYRDVRDEEQRREYMREYMRNYRKNGAVNSVNFGELPLANVDAEPSVKASANPSVDEAFEQFWKAYPKKIAKPAARKAFAKHAKHLPAMLAALDKFKSSPQWTKENGQFIPYPQKWLNLKRWEDELPNKHHARGLKENFDYIPVVEG